MSAKVPEHQQGLNRLAGICAGFKQQPGDHRKPENSGSQAELQVRNVLSNSKGHHRLWLSSLHVPLWKCSSTPREVFTAPAGENGFHKLRGISNETAKEEPRTQVSNAKLEETTL